MPRWFWRISLFAEKFAYTWNQVQNLTKMAMAGDLDHLKNVGVEVGRYKLDHIEEAIQAAAQDHNFGTGIGITP